MAVTPPVVLNVAQWAHLMQRLQGAFPTPDLSMIPAEILEPTKTFFSKINQAVRGGFGGITVVMANEKALRYQDILAKCFNANGLRTWTNLLNEARAREITRPLLERMRSARHKLDDELEQNIKIQEGLSTLAVVCLDGRMYRPVILFFFSEDIVFTVSNPIEVFELKTRS